MLDAAISSYSDPDLPWEPELLVARLGELGDEHEVPKKQRQAAVRLAVTGRSVGPPLGESLVLLGRDEVLARLRAARGRVGEPVPVAEPAPGEPGPG
jgi:glutamyl-tRNA synthetase